MSARSGLSAIFLGLVIVAAFPGGKAVAADPVFNAGGFSFHASVVSMKEARFRSVIKQEYDFSCGSAALATLLTYSYDTPTREQVVLTSMFEHGDKEKIRTQGFSLLDMKRYLESRGFSADGFRTSLSKLAKVGIPAIALITVRGYRHFVVIKGVSRDEVLIGDPALGIRTYSRTEFKKIWNGILFVVTDRVQIAKAHFNERRDWQVRHKAPFGTALSREGLATFTMLLPGPNTF